MKTASTIAVMVVLAAVGRVASASDGPREVLLFDYESDGGRFENSGAATYVAEHATQGDKSGKVTLSKPFDPNFAFYGNSNMKGRWGEFDQFVIDVFVEGGTVKCLGFVVSDGKMGWWDRHNYEFTLPPGKRRLAFSLGAVVSQRSQSPLDLSKLSFFAMRFQSATEGVAPTIYLDNARLVKGTGAFEVKVLYSFERDDAGRVKLEDWPPEFEGRSSMKRTGEHASHGRTALRLDSRAPAGNVQFSGFDGDWRRYDSLAVDVFSASDRPVKIGGWIKPGSATAGYWERHNWDRMLKPGLNALKLSLGGMTNAKNQLIDLGNVVAFNLALDRQTVYFDNIRLVKGVEEIGVRGIKKFDFGPAKSAVMPGFTRVSSQSSYAKSKGYGWLPRAQMGRDFDILEMLGRHRPPDDLCRDFCQPTNASFALDLPNGRYRVWLMLGPPGNGWGQSFKRRTVKAEGGVVVDQRYTSESFKEFEFQFQDEEDLPGDDVWATYIDKLFRPDVFEVDVRDGQLTLSFDAHGAWWCTHLNGLVVFPLSEAVDGERWLAGLSNARREQYEALHVEQVPTPPAPYEGLTDADRARGYVRFAHSPDRDVQVNSVPSAGEVRRGIELRAAPGEYEDGCFGIYPLADCGELTVEAGDLVAPSGARIRSSAITLMVQRYKGLNHGAVYTITPKYLDPVAGRAVDITSGVTRSFWAVIKVPIDAKPGRYRGRVRLAFDGGKTDSVEVSLTVWPIALAEVDFPMGMFMVGPQITYHGLSNDREAYWEEWRRLLEDCREHGMTSIDPLVHIPLKGVDGGKARVDFTAMDRFMSIARSLGFRQELNGYGVGHGFRYRNCSHSDAEARKYGLRDFGELVKVYFDAVREHAREKDWLPICICTDDEYIVHPGGVPSKLAELHRTLQRNAPGFRFVAFDSTKGMNPEQEKMLADIDTWGAGIHTPAVAAAVRKGGRRLWLYNTGMNRFTFGTYMFFARTKYDVKGFFQWVYPSTGTYTKHYLASHIESHYGVVYPSRDGPRPTVIWERLRAGCDDHRYFETARKLIAQSKATGRGRREAKRLEATIERTMSKLTFGKPGADAYSGVGRADNPLTIENMDAFRRAVAEGIVALKEAM